MHSHDLLESIFGIFFMASFFGAIVLYFRQTLLIAYLMAGLAIGPAGLGLVVDNDIISKAGHFGVIFLLFLIGLDLHPQQLWQMLKKSAGVVFCASCALTLLGFALGRWWGYTPIESFILGISCYFSSTIILMKMLPQENHNQVVYEWCVSVALFQDLMAIFVLLWMASLAQSKTDLLVNDIYKMVLSFIGLLFSCFVVEKFIIAKLMRFFSFQAEYIFLLAISWCLSVAMAAEHMGLTYEIGGFMAGVSIATGSISVYIASSLKPVRDFFMVLFFFTLGANFDLEMLKQSFIDVLILVGFYFSVKPVAFELLLRGMARIKGEAQEIAWRLSVGSEFSLLILFSAREYHLIQPVVQQVIQSSIILSFLIGSWSVARWYAVPDEAEKFKSLPDMVEAESEGE